MAREYKIRVPHELPDVTSEAVSGWLDSVMAGEGGGRLAADPGGGPVRISLSLDPEKVVAFANQRGEKTHVALRRLIASHIKIEPPEAKDEPETRAAADLPNKVLPRNLAYNETDFLSIIRGLDKGLALAYRRIYRLKDLEPAVTPAEDRKLAGAMAEVCNRRSPAWFVKNADLFRLAASSFTWSMAQTEQLDAQVMGARRKSQPESLEAREDAFMRANAGATEPAGEEKSPAAAAGIPQALIDVIDEPVQQEGQF